MNGVRGATELQHVCGDVANPLRKMQEQQEFSYPGVWRRSPTTASGWSLRFVGFVGILALGGLCLVAQLSRLTGQTAVEVA